MKLQTQIPLERSHNPIDYDSKLLLLGSCFVENIGDKFSFYNFQSLQNPFGILFHPLAIEKLVSRAIKKDKYSAEEVFFFNERWQCFDAHSNLSDASKDNLIQNLNSRLSEAHALIRKATHIVLTLGTAWVYHHSKTDKTVANCHKVPQKEFSKRLLAIDGIAQSLGNTIDLIRSMNSEVQCILTVSPVRHLKDGYVENQRSKAHLKAAIHQVIDEDHHSSSISYFESYEIMMDELRDYRFYKTDMVHPNQLAIDYIWEKFKYCWISESSEPTMKKVAEIRKGMLHRPFNEDSEQHQTFLKTLADKIAYLQNKYPYMEF